jgi:prolactin regulatory element-binding protein
MSISLDVGYPLYGAQYVDPHSVVVTGGGGEGNNGIPNKITHLSIKESGLNIVDEFEFPGGSDSPTAMDLRNCVLVVSMNESSANVKKGENKHLKKYIFDKDQEKNFKFVDSSDVEESKDPNDYLKAVILSNDGSLTLTLNSKVPSTLRLINTESLKVEHTIEDEKEIKDIAFSPSSKSIAYVTETSLVLYNIHTKEIFKHDRFTTNYSLTKLRFIEDDKIVCAVNLKNKAGVLLLESHLIPDEENPSKLILKTKKAKVFTSKFNKITGFDIFKDSLAAVAGNDNSISLVDLDDFTQCKRYEKVHTFAITKVAFSPDGTSVVSVSAASTVSVIRVPENIKVRYTSIKWTFYILMFAVVFSYLKNQITDDQWNAVNNLAHELFDDGFVHPQQHSSTVIQHTESLTIDGSVDTAFGVANVMPAMPASVSFDASTTLENHDEVQEIDAAFGAANVISPLSKDVGGDTAETTITTTVIETETRIVIDDDVVEVVTESINYTEETH